MARAAQVRLAALVAVVVAHVAVFALVYWAFVRTVTGREFGDAALRGALLTRDAWTDEVDRVLDVVSVAMLLGALAVVATIALLRLARLEGVVALGLMVGANASTWLLKEHLLTRPDLGLVEYTPATLNSLPGGHSTAVLSAVAAVVFVLPHRLRLPVAATGGLFAVITALSTMAAGWHRASDSVAAFLVVGAWTTLAAIVVVVAGRPPSRPVEEPSAGARWFGAGALGALVVGMALMLAVTAVPGLPESAVGQTFALLSGACLVAGTAAAVMLAVLRVLEIAEAVPAQDGASDERPDQVSDDGDAAVGDA